MSEKHLGPCLLGVFNDVEDICMLNGIITIINNLRFYKGMLYCLGKGYLEDGF